MKSDGSFTHVTLFIAYASLEIMSAKIAAGDGKVGVLALWFQNNVPFLLSGQMFYLFCSYVL